MGSLPTNIETGVTPQIQTGSGVGVPLDIATTKDCLILASPTTMGGNEVLVPMVHGGFLRRIGAPTAV